MAFKTRLIERSAAQLGSGKFDSDSTAKCSAAKLILDSVHLKEDVDQHTYRICISRLDPKARPRLSAAGRVTRGALALNSW